MASGRGPDMPIDIGLMQTLVSAVRDHAMYLSNESQSATSGMNAPPRSAAAVYAEAAEETFRALLQRIETVVRQLGGRNLGPDAEIVNVVTAMLADPWVQRVRNLGLLAADVGRSRLLHEADLGVVQVTDACRAEVRQAAAHRDVARRLEQRQAETDVEDHLVEFVGQRRAPSRGRVRRRSARPSRRSPGC